MGCGLITKSMGRAWAATTLFCLTAWVVWAGAARQFELESGPAEAALNEFAVQTGLQVLFPTELTTGVETNTVRGHYSVREALDRMLSDTGLSANYNENTGVIEISRAPLRNETVVRLPPYTVEGETKAWRYAKMGNIEVLSACMDDVTRRVIQQLFRLDEALGQIIPSDLRFRSDTPDIYVLHSDADKAAVPQELIDRLKQQEGKVSGTNNLVWNIGIMNSYGFWDMDSRAIYFILNEGAFMVGRLSIRGDYLRQLLVRRVPAMPAWFVEGVLELYPTVSLEPYGATTFAMEIKNRHKIPGGLVRVAPFVWQSADATMAIRKGHRPEFMPLPELLDTPPPSGTAAYRTWRAQAALFVRWALDDARKGPEALWQLVRLTDTKQPTEADFKACFGLSYADAEADMRRYLPKAIRREFELKPKQFAEMPDYNLRLASELDVSIVKGDLDRLKIGYVRRFSPKLTKRYIEQAKSTLRRAQGLGDVSARLSGLMGLCECDVGDDLAARAWLEQAVAGGDTRPRVCFELARIRFNAARVRHINEALPDDEIRTVLDLLRNTRDEAPPLLKSYVLMADVLSSGRPTADEVRQLAGGLVPFPREVRLIKAVADLWQKQGQSDEARQTIDHGLSLVSDPADRAELIDFREAMALAGEPDEQPAGAL